jgi:hypothetical protein
LQRIIAVVNHSGNRNSLSSLVQGAVCDVKFDAVGSFLRANNLFAQDVLIPETIELGEQKGRRPVSLETSNTVTGVAVPVNVEFASATTGTSDGKFYTNRPANNVVDGNFNSPGVLVRPAQAGQTGSQGNLVRVNIIGAPSIPSGATISKIAFKVRHGGSHDRGLGPATELTNGQVLTMRIYESATLRNTATANSSATIVDDEVTYSASISPANLTNFYGTLDLGEILTVSYWNVWEAWFEVDYSVSSGGEKETGSVINHFDITNMLPDSLGRAADWPDLTDLTVRVVSPGGSVQFRVYQIGVIVIYEERTADVPSEIVCDLTPDTSLLNKLPGEIIKTLWTDGDLGGNDIGTINSAEVTQADTELAATGFSASDISGLTRGKEIWELMTQIAREFRLHIRVQNDVVRLLYAKDTNDLGSGSYPTLNDTDHILDNPIIQFQTPSYEKGFINIVNARYAYTDLQGFTKSLESSAFLPPGRPEYRQGMDFEFLQGDSAASSVAFHIRSRKAGQEQVTFAMPIDVVKELGLEPLSIFALDLRWTDPDITIAACEIIELRETDRNSVMVTAIVYGLIIS